MMIMIMLTINITTMTRKGEGEEEEEEEVAMLDAIYFSLSYTIHHTLPYGRSEGELRYPAAAPSHGLYSAVKCSVVQCSAKQYSAV